MTTSAFLSADLAKLHTIRFLARITFRLVVNSSAAAKQETVPPDLAGANMSTA
jgi:hypothetical protein